MFAMTIDWEKKAWDDLKDDIKAIKDDIRANTTATQGLADHVASQNGRITKLEKIVGRRINLNDPQLLKTARIVFVAVAIIVVGIVSGGRGLDKLVDWLRIGS